MAKHSNPNEYPEREYPEREYPERGYSPREYPPRAGWDSSNDATAVFGRIDARAPMPPRRPYPEEDREPYPRHYPPAGSRPEWPSGPQESVAPPQRAGRAEHVPIMDADPPFYRRTGTLAGIAAGVVALIAAGIGVGAYSLTHSDPSNSASNVAATPQAPFPTVLPTMTPDAPDSANSASVTLDPSTTTDTTTDTTTTDPTTTTTTTTTAPTVVAPVGPTLTPTGRFSGTILSKSSTAWMVTDWDGNQYAVEITPSTKLVPKAIIGPQFAPGQTVNIFWHSVGSIRVADSVYGD